MLDIFNKLIDANQREINRLQKIVQQINSLEPEITKLSDKDLKKRSEELRKKAEEGSNLDELLPEAFALTREASSRVNKARLYDVQLMGGIVLHSGKIAEQKTGEGKTFTAAPAAYLNALTGKGVHIVTVNDYLAKRECGWVGPVYFALGLSCATIVHEQSFIYDPEYSDKDAEDERLKHLRPVSRKEAYGADITYGTNNEFGFDYLRDNRVPRLEDQAQRGHNYAIVDEVDSILIDEARTPLIISAPAQEATEKYVEFTKLIQKLDAKTDFVIDEKMRTANLTEDGIQKIEKMLGVENLYEQDYSALHHLEEALKARTLFLKDRDYVVKNGEVIIVDEFTGRLMPGRRYSEGLHQAIEAKEGVTIQQESVTLATVSFQNYFRMYQKLAGMTGTASTEAEEFSKIYKLDVVVIPTNKPVTREDLPDSIYKTEIAKYNAVIEEVARVNKKGQPVLIGTTSIEKNEYLSKLLKKKGISHALLNAKKHEKEAQIIAKAGEKGAVTLATNMAGRGVDIKLGKGVEKLGGLYVIGTERHESRRIDNQLRGRSGRQGDPGTTKFFISLEDDLMRIFGGEQVSKVMEFLKMPEDMPIEHGMISKTIESAQKRVEGHNFDQRKHTVEYDDVMNQQRQIIYGIRKQILEAAANQGTGDRVQGSENSLREEILQKVDNEIRNIIFVNSQEEVNYDQIIEDFSTIILFDDKSKKDLLAKIKEQHSTEEIEQFLIQFARDIYKTKEQQFGEEISRQLENNLYLHAIDTLWVEHLDTIDDLRAGIGLRGYAGRDPLIEYKREAFDLFERLVAEIDSEVVHNIFKIQPHIHNQPTIGPIVDVSKVVETHEEALDEQTLLEETGQFISSTDKIVDNNETINQSNNSSTKVTIDRGDGSTQTQVINDNTGALVNSQKVGRNDPCPCGSGLKWKRCGLINAPEHNAANMQA